ncbi:hypothetical protein Sjap_002533 [Stephania japonica]|uniref:Uncharacterized protein n=1 Tax=Stephania japonica TaxID=461633 RepID=A0AAP0KM35_9MAGN
MALCAFGTVIGKDGTILAWKYNDSIKSFELAASLKGHNLAVVSLFVGAGKMIYSASMDNTIRVWDLETLQCIEVLTEHTDAVTFEERGRIFSVEEIQAVDILDRSMFFTGDDSGKIRWRKLVPLKPSYENCSSLAMECDCRLAVSKDKNKMQKQDADADDDF